MNAILKIFGRIACKVTKRHVWSRGIIAHSIPDYKAGTVPDAKAMVPSLVKYCKRCGAVVPVKRRIAKRKEV